MYCSGPVCVLPGAEQPRLEELYPPQPVPQQELPEAGPHTPGPREGMLLDTQPALRQTTGIPTIPGVEINYTKNSVKGVSLPQDSFLTIFGLF